MDQQDQITLLTLPPEIQTKIFSHLAAPFGGSTVQGVLRSCRQLYEVALPLSVRVFRNTVPYPQDHGPCSPARNSQFLRYILVSKPWLAKHVKMVILGRLSTDPSNGERDQPHSADKDLAIYQQYMELALGQLAPEDTTSWCSSWVKDLRNGTTDAQVALVLLACPNIQTLLFEISNSRHFTHLLKVAHKLYDAYAALQKPRRGGADHCPLEMEIPLANLQDIFHESANYWEGQQDFHLEASELFALPRLRFYECLGPKAIEGIAANFDGVRRRSSAVEEITLHNAYLTADLLWSMLGACKALRKFEFSFLRPQEFHGSGSMMPRDILEGLLPHADTLEDLYLNLQEDWCPDWYWHSCPERVYLGIQLRQMTALKTLTVGMQILTSMFAAKPDGSTDVPLRVKGAPSIIDCLPENLERLTIHSCGPAILKQVQELVDVVGQSRRFRRLNYICILHHGWRVDTEEIQEYMDKHPNFDNGPASERVISVNTGFQTLQAFYHDLLAMFANVTDRPNYCTSRIYAPHIRKQYLSRRMNTHYTDGVDTYVLSPTLFQE